MKRTTIFIDEHLESDLHALARKHNRSVASLVREAIARYTAAQRRIAPMKLGFVAAGRSGRRDIGERHEELLWRDLDPHGDPAGYQQRRPVRKRRLRRS